MAVTLSPPPMMLMQPLSAMIFATPKVPSENEGISKAPIGPFQMTVFAPLIASPKSFRLSGPMSRPIMLSGMAPAGTTLLAALLSKASAATTSTGSITRML